jgi:VWFA-related protein
MKWLARLAVALTAVAVTAAQQPAPPVRNPSVLRIAVDLVQVDAVVTDSRGRHVTDLAASDFEVLQDGKVQAITTFTYVATAPPDAARTAGAPATAGPSRPLAADQVRRTIAIVVDDLGLSFESTARVRETLRRFVERDVRAGDLVAILRTGAGMGALQQFTTDRRMLNAAVERVRWNFMTRSSAFQSAPADELDAFRNEYFSVGTLGAIQYIVRGVSQMPGRKSVVLLSDGFRMTDADRQYGRVHSTLRTLIDAANRAGVVIYTIDARGLAVTAPGAADDVAGVRESGGRGGGRGKMTATEMEGLRRDELRDTQDGLGVLAADTGGLFIHDNNDIGAGVRRVLDDQQGYYLLGYVPEGSTFSTTSPRFHSLRVRVTRPGLRVRSRRGFIGRPDPAPRARSAESRMIDAVTSPFAGGDMSLRLTSFFGQVAKVGPVLHSFMHIDARDLTFTEEADGKRSSEVEVLAITFGDNGLVADQHSRRYTIGLPADSYDRVLKAGFVYTLRVPVKRPGPYQLRMALRDVKSDRIGSASHFVDVPDVKKGRLTLSGLIIQGAESGTTGAADRDDAVDDSDPKATVALRTFRQGSEASYLCTVYNARRGPAGAPQLETEVRLYRDGAEVFRSPRALEIVPGTTAGEFMVGGTLRFREAFPPGTYVLEVAITDRLAKKNGRTTQTIDFDVIE